jgi:hypothetical protein
MDNFYYIVRSIAGVVLVIVFVVVGIMMSYNNVSTVFPPHTNMCPNYWTMNSNGNCIIPNTPTGINVGDGYTKITTEKNTDRFGSQTFGLDSAKASINFDDAGWAANSSKSATCAKSTWAKNHSILWDGISNYNGKC